MRDTYLSNLPSLGDDAANETLRILSMQLMSKNRRNNLRRTYYDSKSFVHDVAKVVPPIYHSYSFSLGWSAKAVDALARRCALEGFTWVDGDIDNLGLREWLTDSYAVPDLSRALVASLLYGPAFVMTTSSDDSGSKSLLSVRDAIDATGQWNWRTHSLDSALSLDSWTQDGSVNGLTLFLPDRTYTARVGNPFGDRWLVTRSDHAEMGILAEVVPYRPDFRRPLGRSRITRPIMALQDAALRGLMRLEGHMDVYSFPEYWLLGADETMFKNADGSQKDAWRVRMGRIKGIPDDEDATNPRADVKQFTGSDPSSHLAELNALAKMFAREASLPDTAVAITDMANPTSAEAYDSSQYELIAEAEGAMRDWSAALSRVTARALAIQNGLSSVPREFRTIEPKWRDPRYQSKAAVADAGMKQLSAAPWLAETTVGMELLGLSQQQIERAQAERRRSAGSALLERISANAG